MPTYEYACRQCGEHLEVVQSFRDDPLTVCPACGGPLRKVFGAIGIAFKGSGFYRTDSRDSAGSAKPRTEPKEKTASSGDTATAKSGSGTGSGSPAASGSSGDAKSGGTAAGKGDSKAAASS
ncbi:MAG TPA: FmdB family zinc ribbon protein [Acidimicrobiales bacterium]|nr:FmdB family zinc ribbon protein [Acidimicrobiales bacterium]